MLEVCACSMCAGMCPGLQQWWLQQAGDARVKIDLLAIDHGLIVVAISGGTLIILPKWWLVLNTANHCG